MAFIDSTGESILNPKDSVIVADFGVYRLGKVSRCFMLQKQDNSFEPYCAVKFIDEVVPVMYACNAVTRLTEVGSDQWIRMDCVPPDAIPKPGDEIMVLSKERHYCLVTFLEINNRGVRFERNGQTYITAQDTSFVRFIVGEQP